MPKQPAGAVFGALMVLAGLALILNFRGVVDYHADRSIEASRPWRNLFGPQSPLPPQRRTEIRLIAKIIDRLIGVGFLACGSAMIWEAWHGTLINDK